MEFRKDLLRSRKSKTKHRPITKEQNKAHEETIQSNNQLQKSKTKHRPITKEQNKAPTNHKTRTHARKIGSAFVRNI